MLSSLILKYIDLYNNPSLGENPEFFTSLNSFSVVVDTNLLHKNTEKSTPKSQNKMFFFEAETSFVSTH